MPANTTHFPASPAQLRFISALRSERGLAPLTEDEAARLTGGRTGTASVAITELQRMATTTPAAVSRAARDRSALAIPAPSQSVRAGRMLAAGGIEATVTLADGEHVTIQISTRVPRGRGWANGSPGDVRARTNIKVLGQRVGWINVDDGAWTLTMRTRRPSVVSAVYALIEYAAVGHSDLRVQEADRCGRCRRVLTDPVSIDRGIGPECFGRTTGSRHAAIGRVEDAIGMTVTGEPTATDSEVLLAERDRVQDEESDAAMARAADRVRRGINDEVQATISGNTRPVMDTLNEAADALSTALPRMGRAAARTSDSLSRLAEAANVPRREQIVIRDRELIEAALKAYAEDELATEAQTTAALATFDRLARGVQS